MKSKSPRYHHNAAIGEIQRQRIVGALSVQPMTATKLGLVLTVSCCKVFDHLAKMRDMRPKMAYVFGYESVRGQWRAIWAAGDKPDTPHPTRPPKPIATPRPVVARLVDDDQSENDAKAAQMVEAATAKQNTWWGALG